METLNINLTAVDRTATKKAVSSALEKYRILLLTQNEESQPKITQTFSLVPPVQSNEFYSSTESTAIKNVDQEKQRSEYLARISKAVNRLSYWERAIIIQRYMQLEEVYDYEIYNELGMSERKYYRLKSRAFFKLALALNIEVYTNSI
ncbi:ArpU family transcriptional regulator [Bacillus aquiflavi]|uniref:ArpU family transcriptional regulator n=1 Tax=Bacillus aquiflavi TaxID=2672567 RepID=A0A6B3W5I1_9BACI|nr:ArpU family phage packaging/lysis transcriptional regulator [Bacillus aquiflavi]MBA4538812.1 ArpU family transcriptional regulator [Bacillus aquiflavi]NEY83166.1 ArpU family transcriptional regulator [Bacillus aquiflavi]UAC49148.1 ArpU family transcriptional regulator [Bacillus aquiflavi]